ncbi:uncharacterized protein LOC119652986 isoform X2 [Hermetia illucens]|uniref:uncharacterized protein LOC119652986 isoform X2 n=1 Tax=Hermetia illucens TaxID=343691 RepID=UPI0018CC2525|nr:uncharacterized protein LOC119652986 isoform X2 [Hermetia illucens]
MVLYETPKNIGTNCISQSGKKMVRRMLDKSLREKPSQVQIDSNVNLQVLPDGSIQKTTSRIERKIFPPKGKSVVQRPGTYKDFAANIGNIMSSTRM